MGIDSMRTGLTDPKVEEIDVVNYMSQGASRAFALDNRGPIRWTSSGAIDPEILSSYWQHGFYIFE